ncbi:PDR/VanB family oxidoreductase [Hydrogenophaga sp.]|uniref:PDR/VanB family oxidoreductase n=1 Tax=Hydrogenophaga sp. TaxID=1904254 RepID=UPI00271AE899|nr:PDR/VanB family oxidoreductase [Hydrogenophaga sp.]MDO9434951.1 PDR/VanB family oxidoreductase [Hydrogenophaga sp.]
MDSSTSLQVRVARKAAETPDICVFELRTLDGAALPAFDAGAHVDVHLPEGVVRQYSLCNAPDEAPQCYEIAVLRDARSRGGSVGMHALQEGQAITISAPRNHFPLAKGAPHHVLFAGGIGITPILAMAHTLAQQGASFELHYCTRSCATTAFQRRMTSSAFADRVFFHHDDGDAAQKLDAQTLLKSPVVEGAHLYVCGPSGFMEWILAAGRQAGWSEDRLHREYFAGAAIDTSDDGAFEVQIASTGAVITVPADQAVTTALATHGIEVATSCEQGVCGTCLVRVLDGTPDHRDMYLTDEERALNDQFTPCCSRARSARLVLEL